MRKKILYLGNKTEEFSNNKSVIDSLTPLFSEFTNIYAASGKKNQFQRFLEMNYFFFRYGVFSDKILVDVYSTLAFYFAFHFAFLSIFFRKKYILFLHGGNLPQRHIKNPILVNFIFKRASEIIAPSNYLASYFNDKGFNVTVIPNSIYLKDYPFLHRKKLKPRILSMRGLGNPYNPLMTIKAVHYLKKKYPDIYLLMLGDPSDENYHDVVNYIKLNKLEDHIKINPKLPKLEWIEVSKNFDVMVSNPTIDNTPTSLIEGMALGMCVISTDVGGIPYIFNHDHMMFVENDSYKDLAKSIDTLMTNTKLAGELSKKGRFKSEEYDWKNIRYKWIQILEINNE